MSQSNLAARGQVFYDHSIVQLVKELSNPDVIADKFALNLFGIELTYRNLLKFHLIAGLLLLFSMSGAAKSSVDESILSGSFKLKFL